MNTQGTQGSQPNIHTIANMVKFNARTAHTSGNYSVSHLQPLAQKSSQKPLSLGLQKQSSGCRYSEGTEIPGGFNLSEMQSSVINDNKSRQQAPSISKNSSSL